MLLEGEINEGLISQAQSEFNGTLQINSFGGVLNEGLGFYDYLKSLPSDQKEKCEVFGACMSAATFPLLAFDRRIASQNSRFLIHNPWTFAAGESKDFRKLAEDMEKDEIAIVDIYEEHLNITRDEIIEIMASEKYLTAEEALNINLITEIMSSETKEIKETLDKHEGILNQILNVFKKDKVKNLVIQTQDGQELDFGEEITSEEQIVVGVTATADGAPANGEYMRNGLTYIFEEGTLTEIIEPETEMEDNAEELAAEVDRLKAELAERKTENDKLEKVLNEMKTAHNELEEKFKNLSTDWDPEVINHIKDMKNQNTTRKAFK